MAGEQSNNYEKQPYNMIENSWLVLFMIIWSFITTVRMTRALGRYTLDTKKRERAISLFLFQEIKVLQTTVSDRILKRKSSSSWILIFFNIKQKENYISILGKR